MVLMSEARRGELRTAQWSGNDLDAAGWRARQSLATVRTYNSAQDAPKARTVGQSPGSEKGRRDNPLVPEVVKALRHQEGMQAKSGYFGLLSP
jgi:hypothetical protein